MTQKKLRSCLSPLLIILALQLPAQATNPPEDKTLSPYFFVKSGPENLEQFPLKNTTVEVNVSGVISDVRVIQTYENKGSVPIEADYIFPGSTEAAVYAMEMQIGERRIVAEIQEKKKAQQIFDQAKAEGKSASLLQQHRPNVFRMSVANILPGDTVQVELRYTELLYSEEGRYEFVYPTVVGPRYSETPAEGAAPGEDWVANPYLAEGVPNPATFSFSLQLNAGMPIQEMRSVSFQATPTFADATRGRLEFSGEPNQDVVVQYRLAGDVIESGMLLHQGEKENFFLLMAQPPKRPGVEIIPPRDYTFVVDVSGSMSGFPLDTAKQLMENLVARLQPDDTFNLLFFSGGSYVLSEVPLAATRENIQLALRAIENQRGGGGTALLPALKRALQLSAEQEGSRSIVVLTDGYINVSADVFELIRNSLGEANLFSFGIGSSVNRHLIEGMARVGQGEPFVVLHPGEISEAVQRFTNYISTPVLTDIEVTFPGLDVYDVEPVRQPDLLAERPMIVFGKWRGPASGKAVVRGQNGLGAFSEQLPVARFAGNMDNPALRYLWARAKIKQLSDYQDLFRGKERIQEITNLGLTYNLLTQYTSFVAVDKVVRNPDQAARKVKQPLPLPKGVSNNAIGSSVGSTPEPSEWALMLVVLALAIFLVRGKRNQTRKA